MIWLFLFLCASLVVQSLYRRDPIAAIRIFAYPSEGSHPNPSAIRVCGLLAAAVINAISLLYFKEGSEKIFFVLWQLSLLLLLLSLVQRKRNLTTFDVTLTRLDLIVVALVTSVSLCTRFALVGVPALTHFEAVWGNDVLAYLYGKVESPFHWIGDFPSNLPTYFMAWSMYLLPDNPVLALRLPHLIMSALTAPLLYLICATTLQSRACGVFVGMAWALAAWTVNEGVYACNFAIYQFFNAALVAALVIGPRRANTALYLGLSGVICGLLFNMLYVQMVVIAAVGLVYLMEVAWTGAGRRWVTTGRFALFGFAFLLAVSPTLWRVMHESNFPLVRHLEALSLSQSAGLDINPRLSALQNLIAGAARYFSDYFLFAQATPVFTELHLDYWAPLFDRVTNALFLLGLLLCLLKIGTPLPLLLTAMAALMYAPFLLRPASFYRLSALAPIIFIFAGIGLRAVINLLILSPRYHRLSGIMHAGAAAICIAFVGYWNVGLMSEAVQRKRSYNEREGDLGVTLIGETLTSRDFNCIPFIDRYLYRSVPAKFFLRLRVQPTRWLSSLGELPFAIKGGDIEKDLCVFGLRSKWTIDDKKLEEILQHYYPELKKAELRSGGNRPVVASYYRIPRAAIESRTANLQEAIEKRVNGECTDCIGGQVLLVPEEGPYLWKSGRSDATLEISKVKISPQAPVWLMKGAYEFTIDAGAASADKPALVSHQGSSSADLLVYDGALFRKYAVESEVLPAEREYQTLAPVNNSFTEVTDSLFLPKQSPLQIRRKGRFKAAHKGRHTIRVVSIFDAALEVNGKEVLRHQGNRNYASSDYHLDMEVGQEIDVAMLLSYSYLADFRYLYLKIISPQGQQWMDLPNIE
ncbi:MAG: hypothetical protein J5J00_00900 [Deltaproteobacteria bacterium]|nr:hypothetical protein [Deltaproteobacteria bacterium]